MSATVLFGQFFSKYLELVSAFFVKYNATGRQILDFFHAIFDNIFAALLFLAFIVSALYYVFSIYAAFNKKKPIAQKNGKIADDKLPFVTVQIPTFNELCAIRCAKSCLDFDYPKSKYEILIGDDSSIEQISQKLCDFAKGHELIKIIKRGTNQGYKPANLNNMLRHSNGEIIVIFDSDFIPKSDFLQRIVVPFINDANTAGVQARWNLVNSGQNLISVLGSTIVYTCHHITIPFMYQRRKIAFLCGSAEAVRKDVLIELGSWESGNLTEDIEFSLRLLEKGYRIEYLDDLECDSEVPFTLKDLYRQQMRWAYGVIYSWKKHFFDLLKSKNLNAVDKIYMAGIFCSGYLLSVLLAGLFIAGTLSFVTHPPAPVDWGRFFYEMIRNIILTSGIIVASIVALSKAKKTRLSLRMIASSFSCGLVVTYYVNIGIFKALSKMPMEWYMLNKQGNES